MNYYEHHIGDYAAATAHLSLVEDAVYTRMLRRYYLQEGPLSGDLRQIARLVGARSEDEVAAVQAVLDEFFTLEQDGWHQKRADADIARYLEKQGKARSSAAARWSAKTSDCERNANAMRTHSEGNAHQTPDTKQETEQKKKRPARAVPAVTFVPPAWVDAEAWAAYLAMRAKKRAHPTDYACQLVVAELEKIRRQGHDPTESLRQSTRNSWTDVYPPKNGNHDAGNLRNRKLSAVEQVEQAIADRKRDEGFVLDGQAVRIAAR